MTSYRILQLNAVSTAACAVGMLATRSTLYSLFGLETAILLDVLAIGLLAYAGALAVAARSRHAAQRDTAAAAVPRIVSARLRRPRIRPPRR